MTPPGPPPATASGDRLREWAERVRVHRARPRRPEDRAVTVVGLFCRGADEVTIRPWGHRLPRLVILEIARSRGYVPAGVEGAAVDRGEMLPVMRFVKGEA